MNVQAKWETHVSANNSIVIGMSGSMNWVAVIILSITIWEERD